MKAARMDLTLPGEHRKPRLGTEARAGRVLGVLLFTVVFLTSGTRGHWFVSVGQTFSDARPASSDRSEEHTSELQSLTNLVCRLLLEKKKKTIKKIVLSHRSLCKVS